MIGELKWKLAERMQPRFNAAMKTGQRRYLSLPLLPSCIQIDLYHKFGVIGLR